MRKIIENHIMEKNYVRIETGQGDNEFENFDGFIFEQSSRFILACIFTDFNYDGFVVIRKADITKIKYKESEKFFNMIYNEEGLTDLAYRKKEFIDFHLDDHKGMFEQLEKLQLSVILNNNYKTEEKFIIGPVVSIEKNSVKIKYFDACGEFNFQPTTSKFKDITFIKFDDPYANMLYKYAKEVD